jgi:hypothetical protein
MSAESAGNATASTVVAMAPESIPAASMDDLDGGDLIPGFRLPLAALFEDDAE